MGLRAVSTVQREYQPSARVYFKRFYYDTVCRNVPALRMALSMFGTKQIMFGTDIPLREDIELQLRDIEELGLSAADRDAIFAGNAARLLGISLGSDA